MKKRNGYEEDKGMKSKKKHLGLPWKELTPHMKDEIRELITQGKESYKSIAELHGTSYQTVYQWFNRGKGKPVKDNHLEMDPYPVPDRPVGELMIPDVTTMSDKALELFVDYLHCEMDRREKARGLKKVGVYFSSGY